MISPVVPENFYDSVVKVKNGMESTANTQIRLNGNFLIPKGRENDIKSDLQLEEEVEAPLYKDQKLGSISFSLDDDVLAQYSITSLTEVQKMNFKSVFYVLSRQLLKL